MLVTDLDSGRIPPPIQAASHLQSGGGAGGGDQVHDRGVTHQWSAAPVLGDEAEQAVLDLVPLVLVPVGKWQTQIFRIRPTNTNLRT